MLYNPPPPNPPSIYRFNICSNYEVPYHVNVSIPLYIYCHRPTKRIPLSTLLEALHMIRSAPGAFQQCNEPGGVIQSAEILVSTAINCPTKALPHATGLSYELQKTQFFWVVTLCRVVCCEDRRASVFRVRQSKKGSCPGRFFGLTDSVHEGANTTTKITGNCCTKYVKCKG